MSVYRVDLSSHQLNEHVFKMLTLLDIYGVISQIERTEFKNLINLHMLRIKTQNVKHLFARNNEWLEY